MPILKFWKIYELTFDMLKINIEYIFKDKSKISKNLITLIHN